MRKLYGLILGLTVGLTVGVAWWWFLKAIVAYQNIFDRPKK